MKYLTTFGLLFLLVLAGCKQKVLSGPDLEKKLIETMQDYLDKDAKKGFVFTVKDVVYFPDVKKKEYNCDFHVRMQTAKGDTLGMMSANITNDFKKVVRIR